LKAHSTANTSADSKSYSTVGAGDTFIAGLMFAHAVSSSEHLYIPASSMQFAAELAGRKIVQEGFQGLGQAMSQRIAELTGT
jgi:ketohexokinase